MFRELPPRPQGNIIEALKGKVIGPVRTVSNKPGFGEQTVQVKLVLKGAGMVGLEDSTDNQEWAGIFNHYVKTARVATFLTEQLKANGTDVDPDAVLNAVLVSHSGRRTWDEARWYPQAVTVLFSSQGEDVAAERAEAGDTNLALNILHQAQILPHIIELVEAHGQPITKADNLAAQIALYADIRVSQEVMSLDARFADLQRRAIDEPIALGNPPRLSQKEFDTIQKVTREIEQYIFSQLSIKPEDLTENFPAAPRWERYLRRLYINDAEPDIFNQLNAFLKALNSGEINEEVLNKKFPPNTWWGKCVRELFDEQKGKSYQSANPQEFKGIERAINWFKYLDQMRQRKRSSEVSL